MVHVRATHRIILIALCLSILFTFAYAQELGNKKIIPSIMHILTPPSESESTKLANQLDLKTDQRKKMQELYETYVKDTKYFKKQYEVKFQQLLTLMNDQSPNGKRVEKECQEFLHLERQVLNAEIKYWTGLKNTLTKKQNNKLWHYIENRRIK
jgi:hypothetical protein